MYGAWMFSGSAITTYLIPEPFNRAVKATRDALTKNNLAICTELDVSGRMERELNVWFMPCRILLVDSPYLLLEAATLDCSALVLLPLHMVVRGVGSQTFVYWSNAAAIQGVRLPVWAAAPLRKLQSLITGSLDCIGMLQGVYQASVAERRTG